MASRAYGKRSARGPSSHTGIAPSRSNVPVTDLSLLSDDLAETYEKMFKNRTVIKQYVYSVLVAGCMHIPNVVERISFQEIDLFLNYITEYNEDLVKLFYTGVDEKFEGFKFACNIDYEFRNALNQMSRKSFPPNVIQSNLFPINVTTGQLKPLDRILHWVMTHILCPKQRGYSRVDKAKKTLSLMGYTWDRTRQLYKTHKPVPGTNARPVEEYDDDDDDDEDEDGEDEDENNEDTSQPMEHDQQVTDHGDWLGPTPEQHPSNNQGWGEWQHTGWTSNRSSYMPTPPS
ncbi:hypothetical protein KIW84_042615 [Lathyrus oleraceus]|uniref:Uncharacterized protein n=1 Tax=Pisum sativum TaxID=3888 RepID=A0A9D4XDD5_PEA|nr:hypothetical protein KIW84_042615 [Pisum sativum]